MMNTPSKKYDLIGNLRRTFPEIEHRYHEEISTWETGTPGDYNIVGFIFKPFLRTELEKGEMSPFLVRFADFMEEVCRSGDVEAINVVWLKLFKLLLAQPAQLKLLWPILGTSTKLNLEDAATRWDLKRNLPSY